MRLLVLVPSADYLGNAGARIRYARIRAEYAALGGTLDFLSVDDLEVDKVDCDVLLISKCHDARAILGAAKMRERGIKVGVDLFDDYFSQLSDSRLVRYRSWLAQLAPNLSFALCSTITMAAIVAAYREDLPVHVMNDPAVPFDPARLAQVLDDKQQSFRDGGKIELCWFGMGRNPHFPVGVHDLASFGGMLRDIRGHSVDARLTLLTNAHALAPSELAALNRLPIQVTVEPWSEVRESEVLASAHAAFIPVNAQAFSVAKSLNRAWTALTAGCQVLSAGFPLYEPLAPVIYYNIDDLLQDLGDGQARLRADNLDKLAGLYRDFGSAAHEADRLLQFLSAFAAGEAGPTGGPLLGVVHGASTSGAIHVFAERHDALGIRSPFCAAEFAFDVSFRALYPGAPLHVFIGERAKFFAEGAGCDQLVPKGHINGRPVWSLPGSPAPEDLPANWTEFPLGAQMAAVPSVNRKMKQTLTTLFGSINLVLAENSAWPFAGSFEALS
jgi:hypothetical protein